MLAIKRHNIFENRRVSKESPNMSHLDGCYPVSRNYRIFLKVCTWGDYMLALKKDHLQCIFTSDG
jgi:hypothetical protein